MIAIVVDSNSQLPAGLRARHGIQVVPLTVTVNGVDHLEGVDLTDADFYRAWEGGTAPTVATSQPSPGQFVEVYERAVAAGATEIVSIHLTESMSGTLNSARIASEMVDVPVRLVDTGTASFGISCCAWAAADAIAGGSGVDEAVAIAERLGAELGSAFIVGVPALADRSGRVRGVEVEAASVDGIPVLSMSAGTMDVLDTVTTVDAAVDAMVRYALDWPPRADGALRIAVGTSDVSSGGVSAALTEALRASARSGSPIGEIIQYTIGPSVGAHTGPGTAGLFVF